MAVYLLFVQPGIIYFIPLIIKINMTHHRLKYDLLCHINTPKKVNKNKKVSQNKYLINLRKLFITFNLRN